jgi:hypothetical protein
LHVLGLPPAFVLSQNQTLKLSVRSDETIQGKSDGHCLLYKHLVCVLY